MLYVHEGLSRSGSRKAATWSKTATRAHDPAGCARADAERRGATRYKLPRLAAKAEHAKANKAEGPKANKAV